MGKLLKIFGIGSVLAFPVSLILYRLAGLPFSTAFQIILLGAVVGAAVLVIGLLYFLIRRKADPAGAKAAITGAIVAIFPLLPLAMQAHKGTSLPSIHNISTDTRNAPQFDKIASIRTENDNPHAYDHDQTVGDSGALVVGAIGLCLCESFPDVHLLSVAEALSKAEQVAKSMGWEIVNIDVNKGILEATETTLLWGFKDDIIVRVVEQGGQTLVDLRSVSRIGRSDLGVNAARIEKFIEQFSG